MTYRHFEFIAAFTLYIIAAGLISYGLALIGHPNSVWLWVDIFGVAL